MKKILCTALLVAASHSFAECRNVSWPAPDELYQQIARDNFSRIQPAERPTREEVCYQATDLNGDALADFFITLESRYFCGSRGCMQYIYRSLPNGRFEKIGEEIGYVDVRKSLSGWTVNGYSVLVTATGSAISPSFGTLIFDGKMYR